MSAHIDWSKVLDFHPHEFRPNELHRLDPEVVYRLQRLRHIIGRRIYPSPAEGAIARFDDGAKYSQHYAVGRMSTAIDVFCEGDPLDNFIAAVGSRLFNGIGIYPYTVFRNRNWVMLHLDTRLGGPVYWARDSLMQYHNSGERMFWSVLRRIR